MKPLNGYLKLKKNAKVETKSGIIVPEAAQEEVKSTGFEVLDIATDVMDRGFKIGDTVFPGYAEEARYINGFVFCKASHLIAWEAAK